MASWELNDTVWDKYDAYGEVPIPGTRTLHLPQGDVKVSFHTEIAGTMEGGGLPIPRLSFGHGSSYEFLTWPSSP